MILFSPFVVFVTDTANISTPNPTPRPYSTLKYLTLCPRASLSMSDVGQQNCFIASSKRKHKHKQSPAKILFIHWNIQKLKQSAFFSQLYFWPFHLHVRKHFATRHFAAQLKRGEETEGAANWCKTNEGNIPVVSCVFKKCGSSTLAER